MYSHERMTQSMKQDEQETMGEHEHAINCVVGSGMIYPHGCANVMMCLHEGEMTSLQDSPEQMRNLSRAV